MRSQKIEGIVIRRRNVGEADKLLTIFTRELGKIQVKAKGVRRITSRRSPHIELLNHTAMTLYRGSGMPILTEANVISDFAALKKNLTRTYAAYHICELIDGLCPENQEHADIFDLLKTTLRSVSTAQQIKPIVKDFEVQLLMMLGFWNENEVKDGDTTHAYIENLLERKLKSKSIFSKL